MELTKRRRCGWKSQLFTSSATYFEQDASVVVTVYSARTGPTIRGLLKHVFPLREAQILERPSNSVFGEQEALFCPGVTGNVYHYLADALPHLVLLSAGQISIPLQGKAEHCSLTE